MIYKAHNLYSFCFQNERKDAVSLLIIDLDLYVFVTLEKDITFVTDLVAASELTPIKTQSIVSNPYYDDTQA